MKKWLLILGVGIFIGCSNNENLRIEENTPIPLKTVKGDSYVFLDDIEHKATPRYMIYDKKNEILKIFIETKKDDVEKVNLIINGEKKEMESMGYEGRYETFMVEVPLVKGKEINYYFEVIDDNFRYFYGDQSSYEEKNIKSFSYTANLDIRELPEWSKGLVWYSIYVDRFRDGNSDNTPIYSEFGPEYYFRPSGRLEDGTLKSELISPERWQTKGTLQGFEVTKWSDDWNTPPYPEIVAKNKYYPYAIKNTRRYGGDLQGVEEKLDYLKSVGVEGVNLSPVFYSNSSHKLDTIDYGHISPDFGITTKNAYRELEGNLDINTWTKSDLYFQNLIDDIHEKGMRIILDVNFSYVSPEFFAYKDFIKNKEKSKYKNWFLTSTNINNTKENVGIEGNQKIQLNLEDKELQDYLIKATSKWVRGNKGKGIDGYFIKNDISNEEFLEKLKKEFLNINKDFILVGELTAKNENYVGKYGFDILGSYELGMWVQNFLANSNKSSIEDIKGLMKGHNLKTYRWNFLESYDTDRFYSTLVNPNREFDRLNNYGKDDYINVRPDLVDPSALKKLKLAALIQLTIDGSPAIYYGSEKAMWGADAPDSRKPMLWDDITYENETDSLENYTKNQEKIAKIFKTDLIKNKISYEVSENKDLENWYKQISEFRSFDSELLKKGDLEVLNLDDKKYSEDGSVKKIIERDVLAYKREYKGRSAIIIINRSNAKKKINIPVEENKGYTDFYTGDRYEVKGNKIHCEIDGYGYLVLYRRVKND